MPNEYLLMTDDVRPERNLMNIMTEKADIGVAEEVDLSDANMPFSRHHSAT